MKTRIINTYSTVLLDIMVAEGLDFEFVKSELLKLRDSFIGRKIDIGTLEKLKHSVDGTSSKFNRFLLVLIFRNKVSLIDNIIEYTERLIGNKSKKVIAYCGNDADKNTISRIAKESFGDLSLEFDEDISILSGFVLKSGNEVLDCSIEEELKNFKTSVLR